MSYFFEYFTHYVMPAIRTIQSFETTPYSENPYNSLWKFELILILSLTFPETLAWISFKRYAQNIFMIITLQNLEQQCYNLHHMTLNPPPTTSSAQVGWKFSMYTTRQSPFTLIIYLW